jgi:hypothetical protein
MIFDPYRPNWVWLYIFRIDARGAEATGEQEQGDEWGLEESRRAGAH